MTIKYFDMFAGIGGFRSGLEAIGGFECIGYCEIDKYAKQAYDAIYDTGGELYFDDARKIVPELMAHLPSQAYFRRQQRVYCTANACSCQVDPAGGLFQTAAGT